MLAGPPVCPSCIICLPALHRCSSLCLSYSFPGGPVPVRLPPYTPQHGQLQCPPTTMAARDTSSLLVGLLVLFHTWGAWAGVEVNMEDRVEVYRGETAQITCMFTSFDGVSGMPIQWFYTTRSGNKQRIYYQNSTKNGVDGGTPFTDRISVNGTGASGEIVLTINAVELEDELEFICSIKTGEGRTQLKVFETPGPPSIEGVQTGISVNEYSKIGTCEVKNGFPKPNIAWYRNNTPLRAVQNVLKMVPSITTESSGLFSVKSELSMTVRKEDKDDLFYCEVTYFVPGGLRMTETNQINITVYYPSTAVSVWVESPKGKIKEGDSIELHCNGNGNMPSSILSFSYGEGKTLEGNMLVLDNVTRLNSGVYHCSSMDTDTFEEVSGNTTVFINYLDPAVVMPKDSAVVTMGKEFKATCNALSSLQTHTVWFKDEVEVSVGHSLILKDATFDTAGTYTCVVTVPEIEGMETSGTLDVNVQGPPQIINPDFTEVKKSLQEMVDLSCNVRGFPAPSVIWSTSDGKILKTTSQTETKEGVESVVSIKVTADITAFCNASNDFGNDAVTFNITATKPTPTPAATTTSSTIPATTSSTTIPDNTSSSTIPATTSSTTIPDNTSSTAIPAATVKAEIPILPKKIKKEGNGVIIAVIIICILLLAILGSVLYFLYKKGKICGRSGKQDLTKEKTSKDNIVVEMKSDSTEEAVLLGVNGDKQSPRTQ
ncbi:melanoma cell adhesion molecule b isoform X2 [Cottoperca gobio]|uniref:Melanoma cell adhesion molecule b isoform X2 n=1 Tax=Cottoperca gobio TaxID=56716 RepID=A0A6J2QVP3_COTGO|nr:cell surface glycoprotein MUC18-like isoform X2 [Cottoperca gobio]